jgi:radical SAM protein
VTLAATSASTTSSAVAVRTLRRSVEERPFLVIWEVTRACALVCAHCRADAQHCRDPRELDTAEGRRLLDQLAEGPAPHPMVVLTGGDPFERDDLAELVAHGVGAGLHVSLAPSVTPLLTAERLVGLRRAGASAVSLSLDGAGAATHDGFRGVPGVFDRTVAAAALVREAGFRLQVNTTVTAGNVEELPAILELVAGWDASLWSVFLLVPTGRGDAVAGLGAHDVEEVLHWLHDVSSHVAVKATEAPHFRRLAMQRAAADDVDAAFPPGPLRRRLRVGTVERLGALAGPRRSVRPPLDVNAGRGFAFVDHTGTVFPSGFLPLPAGSVRDRPFGELYRRSPLLRSLRDPSLLGGRCGRCEYRDVCGGSRSRAYAVSGDPLDEDPACAHVPGPG